MSHYFRPLLVELFLNSFGRGRNGFQTVLLMGRHNSLYKDDAVMQIITLKASQNHKMTFLCWHPEGPILRFQSKWREKESKHIYQGVNFTLKKLVPIFTNFSTLNGKKVDFSPTFSNQSIILTSKWTLLKSFYFFFIWIGFAR